MARQDPFVEYTLELLEPFGLVQARAMFGGWGLYQAGRIFGLIIQGRLYLKTDDISRADFEAAGGEPFIYDSGKGKPVAMSYWTPPSDAVDDAHALLPWARRAADTALRAANKKSSARKSPAKKAPVKKAPVKKSPAKKATARKTAPSASRKRK